MATKCEKHGCRPRINDLGVSWCTECGKLFSFNLNHKSVDKNFLILEHKINHENGSIVSLNEKEYSFTPIV